MLSRVAKAVSELIFGNKLSDGAPQSPGDTNSPAAKVLTKDQLGDFQRRLEQKEDLYSTELTHWTDFKKGLIEKATDVEYAPLPEDEAPESSAAKKALVKLRNLLEGIFFPAHVLMKHLQEHEPKTHIDHLSQHVEVLCARLKAESDSMSALQKLQISVHVCDVNIEILSTLQVMLKQTQDLIKSCITREEVLEQAASKAMEFAALLVLEIPLPGFDVSTLNQWNRDSLQDAIGDEEAHIIEILAEKEGEMAQSEGVIQQVANASQVSPSLRRSGSATLFAQTQRVAAANDDETFVMIPASPKSR